METLINAHGAGFAQGFSKLSCRKRPGKHMLAREVLAVTWWGLQCLSLFLAFPLLYCHSFCPASGPQSSPTPILVNCV
jgi:hypothetical protein